MRHGYQVLRVPASANGPAQIAKYIIDETPAVRSLTSAVNFLRRPRPIRALGLMQKSPTAKAEHAKCCSDRPTPVKSDQTPGGTRECCKSIHAVPLPDAKGLVKYDASIFAVHAFALLPQMGGEVTAPSALTMLCESLSRWKLT